MSNINTQDETTQQNIIKPIIGDFYKPKKTQPRNHLTSNGNSKNPEWIQIEGCPCKIISINEDKIKLNSFSSSDREFTVSHRELNEDFIKSPLVDGFITNLDKYFNGKIHESEFGLRKNVKNLIKQIIECVKKSNNPLIKEILGTKFWQIKKSMGNSKCLDIPKYNKFINGDRVVNTLERYGDPIFNRHNRWVPIADISYDQFKNSPSYPAPMGIRNRDFCLPSELIKTIKELVSQILSFDNIGDTKCFEQIINNDETIHKCHWCGEQINAQDYSSEYCSSDNFIEICHRNPHERFLETNMYWGHGECNRRQGGYSEIDRIEDALRLIKNNQNYFEKYKDNNPFN
jgi:hypothetical protein